MTKFHRRFRKIGAVLIALSLIVFSYLVRSPSEITRVRNSLILDLHSELELTTAPGQHSGHLQRSRHIPEDFPEIGDITNSNSVAENTFEKSLTIAKHLTQDSISIGTPIQSDTRTALSMIVDENVGYCSDFTQVFNAIAMASDIPVREWAMSFDGFSGKGHAFNEIYDADLEKWIFIDSFYSLYAVDVESGIPLSVLEFRDRLRSENSAESIKIVPIDRNAFAFRSGQSTREYYQQGLDQFYLWTENDVFRYESNKAVDMASNFGRIVEQAVAVAIGVHPKISILPSVGSDRWVRRLKTTRILFIASFIMGCVGLFMYAYGIRMRKRES